MIDMQNDFGATGGMFERAGNHDASLLVIATLFGWVSSARAVCDALARQTELVRPR